MPAKKSNTRYIAFLGGINLGNRRIKMDDLRALFEALSLANVSTFIASGNVIFESLSSPPAQLESVIENHLQTKLGYPVPTFLRTPAEVHDAVAQCPFSAADLDAPNHILHVGFLRREMDQAAAGSILALRSPTDDFHLRGRELYWLRRGGTAQSQIAWQKAAKKAGIPSTARNFTMLRRLLASL